MLFSTTFRSMLVVTLGTWVLPSLSFSQTPVTKTIPLVCSNNSTADLLGVSYELTATPLGPVREGEPVDIEFTGIGNFSADLLNGAVQMFPSLTSIRATAMNATVAVRSGATGDDVLLNPAASLPRTYSIPISHNPACAAAGYSDPCVLQPIAVPLNTRVETYVPGAAGSNILLGWDETLLPPVPFNVSSPAGPNGARVTILVIFNMGLECYMARLNDSGSAEPLLDSDLLAIPIEDDLSPVDDELPSVLGVSAAPNPFNPSTRVSYTVPERGDVRLDVFSVNGFVKSLVNEYREAGTYGVTWDGTDRNGRRMPSGVYLVKVSTRDGSTSSKVMMVK